jgi:hypothetical protein
MRDYQEVIMYPPYTQAEQREIEKNFAKFVIGLVLMKIVIFGSINLLARAFREK